MRIPYHPEIKVTALVYNNCDTHPLPSRSQPPKCCRSVRIWQQCCGTYAMFCWWTLCHKEQRSTQMPTAQLYESSEEHCKTNGEACCQKYLKHTLGGKRFSDNEKVKVAVKSWLSNQAADLFEERFQNLIIRIEEINDIQQSIEDNKIRAKSPKKVEGTVSSCQDIKRRYY
ncbi:hypothetical protein TNCV_3046551 [Trichonephila clavipes]|uniref:Uncharacterized protein n=1 Tax=Trichonephila clavipes TaxID=2585209 RepID=A0A8X6V0U8_TRICX|nr:hypothetical protein TNCV_3046551 [Trichonephila clavipes]